MKKYPQGGCNVQTNDAISGISYYSHNEEWGFSRAGPNVMDILWWTYKKQWKMAI